MKPRVLGTGLTGLVGSRLVELLSDKYDFFNLDLTTGVDITNIETLRSTIDAHPAQVLIHFAAFTDVNRAHEETNNKDGLVYKVNVVGTENVARVCQEKGIYLIHISTDFVFSGSKKEEYTEDDVRDPIEWYGQTKAWAEEVVERTLGNYAIARLTYPFRSNFSAKPDIVKKIRQGLEAGTLPPQFTDTVITPTFVDDIARALDVFIEKKPQGIYHLVGTTHCSPYELAVAVAQTFGFDSSLIKKGSVEDYLRTSNRPYQRFLATSNTKIGKKLGIVMTPLEKSLQELKVQES